MRANPLALWELRVANLRVYYDVVEVPPRTVFVRAVGVKERDRVRIGGRQVGHEVLQDDALHKPGRGLATSEMRRIVGVRRKSQRKVG